MPMSLDFINAVLRETYGAALDIQLDMSRQLFLDPNPPLGPPLPKRWYGQQTMFDPDPFTGWSATDDYDCECCR